MVSRFAGQPPLAATVAARRARDGRARSEGRRGPTSKYTDAGTLLAKHDKNPATKPYPLRRPAWSGYQIGNRQTVMHESTIKGNSSTSRRAMKRLVQLTEGECRATAATCGRSHGPVHLSEPLVQARYSNSGFLVQPGLLESVRRRGASDARCPRRRTGSAPRPRIPHQGPYHADRRGSRQ
jgi:hypothetical protein